MRFLIALIALSILIVSSVSAEVPQVISYQGRMLDSNGDPVADGIHCVEFKIYAVASGPNNPLWVELQCPTTVDGFFSALIGSDTELTPELFGDSIRYLALEIDGPPQIDPRTRFVSVPYALRAAIADSSKVAAYTDSARIATELSMSETTRYLSIPASSLIPSEETMSVFRGSSGLYIGLDTLDYVDGLCPILLPDGAVIKKIRVFHKDNDDSEYIVVSLFDNNFQGFDDIVLTFIGDAIPSQPWPPQTLESPNINYTVDNQNSMLTLRVGYIVPANPNDIYISFIQIEYTIDDPIY